MRGVSRLMLRLPALRDILRPLAVKSDGLLSLCEAYDDACETLERLRIPKTGDDPMRLESGGAKLVHGSGGIVPLRAE
jgi:hypothetical protein